MIEKLVKYCPAVPRIRYRPYPIGNDNALEKIKELIKAHQTLVISGRNQDDFHANCGIGKTMLAYHLIAEMEKEGKIVTYFNLQELADPESMLFFVKVSPRFVEKLNTLEEADIYIFDEVQYVFPRSQDPMRFNESFIHFWNKVGELVKNGKKIIFVTAAHPLNPSWSKFLFRAEMYEFFLTAPVLELEPRRK
jgi:hypothetical protein